MTTSQARPLGPTVGEQAAQYPTLLGHPAGLFTLFFAEMWERFCFYGMKALLLLYMTKSFLAYSDAKGYGILGAYTSLVYMTPFIGGILADRLLGPRRAVIIGGILMAIGEILIGFKSETAFFFALALLVCGNGFFKPNISTIVGTLYPRESKNKDAGFTIFYMGINLGAALAPILCAYMADRYGWAYGFGLAAIGMLIGVSVFAAPTRLTQLLIAGGAIGTAVLLKYPLEPFAQFLSRIFLVGALLISATIAVIALNKGALPKNVGQPRDPEALGRKLGGFIRTDAALCLGILVSIPIFALLVRSSSVTGVVLGLTGASAFGYIVYDAFARCGRIERHRIYVILILMFFSMLFWTFFEQAASSVNIFTDRNVDRVSEARHVEKADVGTTIQFRIPLEAKNPDVARLPYLSQEQLGHNLNGEPFTMTKLDQLRDKAKEEGAPDTAKVLNWPITESDIGMGIDGKEVSTPEFQAVNPVCILLFGLLFSMLWGFLARRNLDPSTPVKFTMALVQLGLGFGALWYGAKHADQRGMVAVSWLLLSYLLQTTGELCLSPVGLSMITRLSPVRIVSTMMGAWFLATAFSEWLAGQLAQLTSVGHGAGGEQVIPVPLQTVHVYGNLYGHVALAAFGAAVVCLVLSPLLKRWEHVGEEVAPATPASGSPVQNAE